MILETAQPRAEAVRVILEGVKRDPFHVPLQFELAAWLEARAKDGDESALRAFRECMRTWEPYLKKNVRNQKAL